MSYGLIKKNLFNNIIISDNELMDYINTRITEENIKDLVSFINICDYGESYYNPESKELVINSEEIFEENIDEEIPDLLKLINKEDKNKYKLDNPNLGNIYNLFTINHEINHLIQKNEIINNNDKLRSELFSFGKIIEFMDDRFFKSFYYKKYHDRFYNEYNANIEAYYEVISLLEAYKLNNIENDLILTNQILSKHLLYLYSDIDKKNKYSTPIVNSLKLYKHLLKTLKLHDVEVSFDTNIIDTIKKEKPNTQLDKLLLGFSINKDTHKYLKCVSSGKIKTLNLFNDINY